MGKITNISKSALDAFGVKQAVTAYNIANIATSDYKASATTITEKKGSGVKASVIKGSDSVDISKEAVDLLTTKTNYGANLKNLAVEDSMMKDLLDIVK